MLGECLRLPEVLSDVEQHHGVNSYGPLSRGSEVIMALEEPVGHGHVHLPKVPTVSVGPFYL